MAARAAAPAPAGTTGAGADESFARRDVVGRVRILEDLVFVERSAPLPADRELATLAKGDVVPVLALTELEEKENHARTRAGRPGLISVLFNGRPRLVPAHTTERVRS